jgi:hypothetical protein
MHLELRGYIEAVDMAGEALIATEKERKRKEENDTPRKKRRKYVSATAFSLPVAEASSGLWLQ